MTFFRFLASLPFGLLQLQSLPFISIAKNLEGKSLTIIKVVPFKTTFQLS